MLSEEQGLALAAEAAQNAHAPYSQFRVGAVLVTDEDTYYAGCNVENAAYPEGTCAEAGALAALVLDGGRTIAKVFIWGADATQPLVPCGGCRQKLVELGRADTLVICGCPGHNARQYKLAELLPEAFSL